jgi:hypothetical protein
VTAFVPCPAFDAQAAERLATVIAATAAASVLSLFIFADQPFFLVFRVNVFYTVWRAASNILREDARVLADNSICGI